MKHEFYCMVDFSLDICEKNYIFRADKQESGKKLMCGKEVIGLAETAYCVKCRTKREMVDAQKVTMKNGRPAMKGKCASCGTGMYKILSSK